jgi:hypothetical protein
MAILLKIWRKLYFSPLSFTVFALKELMRQIFPDLILNHRLNDGLLYTKLIFSLSEKKAFEVPSKAVKVSFHMKHLIILSLFFRILVQLMRT